MEPSFPSVLAEDGHRLSARIAQDPDGWLGASVARRYGGHHVTVHARQDGSNAVVEVRDDGEGIPAALTSRIFEPYETAHGATSVTGSVGLGLTVSRELARLMGGDLTYRRIDDHTVFRLVLPGADIDANRLVS